MDLWIRTQKRLDIFKVNNVQVDGYDIYTYINDGNYTLGEYNSRERALEVLNEIQELLQTRVCFENYNSCNLIYEMPKE